MIKVMIVDDEPEICRLIGKMVERQPDYQVVAECGDFAGAVMEFTKYKPDVVFMDIDLGSSSGLECAKVMVELNPKVKIIFATAHSEYMANAFEIYAFDYLVKPFNMERLVKTLNRIRDILGADESSVQDTSQMQLKDKLLIKGKEQTYFLDTQEILYVERMESYTNIVTGSEAYKTSLSLAYMEEKLDNRQFVRCHKSYIVNLAQISRIEPYGRWTYVVKFRECKDTALMTNKSYEEVKKRFL